MAKHMRRQEVVKDRDDVWNAAEQAVHIGPEKPRAPRERRRHGHVEAWEVVSVIVVPVLVTLCMILADMASRGRLGW